MIKIHSDKTPTYTKIHKNNRIHWKAQWKPATFLATILTKIKTLHRARTSKALCNKCPLLTNVKLMEWL